MEHAMSPRFEAYVRRAIGDATTCPHGHPIAVGTRIAGVPLADCAARRLGADPPARERGRGPPALPQGGTGSSRGARASSTPGDDEEVVIRWDDGESHVTRSVAETVSVLAEPSPPPRTSRCRGRAGPGSAPTGRRSAAPPARSRASGGSAGRQQVVEAGQHQHDGRLHEFGRLQPDEAEVEPALRALADEAEHLDQRSAASRMPT